MTTLTKTSTHAGAAARAAPPATAGAAVPWGLTVLAVLAVLMPATARAQAMPPPAAGAASAATLTPPAGRIGDKAIARDQARYESLQSRIRALHAAGRRARDAEPLAGAQCWLDASWHEYTRNDRSDFPQAALERSEALVAALERGEAAPALAAAPAVQPVQGEHPTPAGSATPAASGSPATGSVAADPRLRPDLWRRAGTVRASARAACAGAATAVACAEVGLVHAAHEERQFGWRHARRYWQIAEDRIDEAESQASRCRPR